MFWSGLLSDRKNTGFFAVCSEGLFWVAFIERALEGFLVASATVTFRLLKANGEDILVVV
jgi:hypothetical protein